jgi:hypothetical protein
MYERPELRTCLEDHELFVNQNNLAGGSVLALFSAHTVFFYSRSAFFSQVRIAAADSIDSCFESQP